MFSQFCDLVLYFPNQFVTASNLHFFNDFEDSKCTRPHLKNKVENVAQVAGHGTWPQAQQHLGENIQNGISVHLTIPLQKYQFRTKDSAADLDPQLIGLMDKDP